MTLLIYAAGFWTGCGATSVIVILLALREKDRDEVDELGGTYD